MMLSFTTLALTGLPQKFPSSPVSIAFVGMLGGIETLRTIHHSAAIVMMLGTAWHILVFGYLAYVRRTRLTMLPTLQDVQDGWQALLYNIGRAKTPPQMGRYTFEEKMEYWAFVWGAFIMGATGFMMWNPITASRFLPGEVIPAAKAAHGGEALLAVLAIIIWHLYGVHIKRFNRSMFNGRMTEEEMLHEHPLELADIKAGIAERPVDPVALRKRQRLYLPVAAILGALHVIRRIWVCQCRTNSSHNNRTTGADSRGFRTLQTPTPAPTLTPTAPATETPLPTLSPTTGPEQTPDSTPSTPAVASDLTWDNSIGALFQTKCTACHGAGALGGLNLSTYADAMKGGSFRSCHCSRR